MSLTVSRQTEDLLRAESDRTGIPAEELLTRAVRAQFAATLPPFTDAELEAQARREPARHLVEAFIALTRRQRDEGALPDSEREELLRLLEHLETHHVRRLEAAAELARRRNEPLPECMRRLGIRPIETGD